MIIDKQYDSSDPRERLFGLIAKLRGAGYRMTNQRQAVLEALVFSERHPGAEELYRQVLLEHPSMSRATVYKTLEMLRGLGEVLELEFRDGSNPANRYDGMRPYSHPHLVCVVCGAIEDVLADPLQGPMQDLLQSTGYELDRYRLDLYGRCPACRMHGTQ
jgi:Fur family transcriptional regulator, peroxide stress response regulator